MNIERKTLPELAEKGLDANKTGIAISTKRNGKWVDTTIDDFKRKIKECALGLYELGIRRGDKVALHSENSAEWLIVDQAILSLGAVCVPIYTTQPGEQIKYILDNSKAKIYIVSTEELYESSKEFVNDDIPTLNKQIMILDEPKNGMMGFDELLKKGAEKMASDPDLLQQCRNEIDPDDLATLMYTSGTTGVPKGVMLTHHNIGSNIQSIPAYIPFDIEANRQEKVLSFLPLSHAFERVVSYNWLHLGFHICYIESTEEIVEDIQHIHPVFFATVPRLLEKLHAGFRGKANELSGFKQKLFKWALHKAEHYDVENPDHGIGYKIANKLVYSKLHEALGGRLKAVISGGAALSPEVMSFINGIGVVCSQGYGLTETSPVLTIVDCDALKAGTVGQTIPDVQVKIADDGEILAKGPNIMKGYFKMPEQTKEVFNDDGWFMTGDIGKLDDDGYLYITDRKKALFKLSTGKYVAPQHIEGKLVNSMFIEQAVVIGNGKKFCSALIIPDYGNIRNKLHISSDTNPEELVKNQDVLDLLQKQVDYANKQLPKWESVKKYKILTEPFSIEGGELTPKLSVKRSVVFEKYGDLIDSMYND